MAIFGMSGNAAMLFGSAAGKGLSQDVTRQMFVPKQVTDPMSLSSRSGQVAAATQLPIVHFVPGGGITNAVSPTSQNIIGGGGSVRTPTLTQTTQQPMRMPSQVVVPNVPQFGGPAVVNVPGEVAQAIAAGDANAAAAVNAYAGGSPGGAAIPGPDAGGGPGGSVSAANTSGGTDSIWGPRLFGLGIIAAGAVLVFMVGQKVK